jgi:translation elongation factor EF-Tu-like GTPase
MAEEKNLGSVEVSLAVGQEWAKKYRNTKEEEGRKKVNAYLIPLESIKLVLEQDIDAVRAYVGINNAGEQNVMLVGTKLNKETGIYVDVFKKAVEAKNNGGDVVYDASRPSPPYDDPDSPMNQ